MLLLNADDGKCSTFIGFLDNVLSEHFNLNADSITVSSPPGIKSRQPMSGLEIFLAEAYCSAMRYL